VFSRIKLCVNCFRGGWFDAGDYSKYVLNAVPAVFRLLYGYDIVPTKYGDDWNIPESGNGIPDVLDEAFWELTWLEKMQTSDGGVYNKVASESWESGLPQVADLAGYAYRYILPQSTEVTAVYGALFAMAARIWRPFSSSISSRFLNRSLLVWNFLLQRPTQIPVGGFKNPSGHISGPYP
jgi:endoglucanase